MRLSSLELINFRNYTKLSLQFPSNLIVLLGENAQGKTNLLESIYALATTKSHRTSKEKEMIKWNEPFARIEAKIEQTIQSKELELVISQKGRKTKVNGLELTKLSDYVGNLNVVLFAPEDLTIVKGTPQLRRRFLDIEMGQMSANYLYQLSNYQTILKQRNHYLKKSMKEKKFDPVFLSVLNEQLVEFGTQVIRFRCQFVKQLNKEIKDIHNSLSNQKEELHILYLSSLIQNDSIESEELKQRFIALLAESEDKDRARMTTTVGPHRDDLVFEINGFDVGHFGSQGQQRTTALSLKLAEIKIIEQETGETPILLLDDVLSELDDNRQIQLIKAIEGKIQTFITTTGLTHLKNKLISQPEVLVVNDGEVRREITD